MNGVFLWLKEKSPGKVFPGTFFNFVSAGRCVPAFGLYPAGIDRS